MAATIKVYRIERHNTGMYGSGLWYDATEGYNTAERQPNPRHDAILQNRLEDIDNMHFGFRSKKQLKAWVFKKAWRDRMAERNGVVKVFEVPKDSVIIGEKQVVFKMDAAKHIASISPAAIK